ncbi:E3 ubiquitin-protein ligase CCNB1IP1-like [Macrosteles quadrilineatus]|uniref:E3 ubiquitin-protein ligase CCNB1IP1-like n=1 Tax=Macrosteles quadrilineatus TaxID=74068 RepID=UPI0023E0FD7E|nr:E3 ubiquitin-protein ligase CCNB1IP1-like [Macrosteles quadrilineatus]
MDGTLYCNDKKCHRSLTGSDKAWITSCSHIFCREHFPSGPASVRKCPCCSKDLSAKHDVYEKNLNPSDAYQSVALAGFSPSTILEIGFNALKFLNFQSFHEKMFLQSYIKRQNVKLAKSEVQQTEKEAYYQAKINELKKLIQQQTQKCETLQRDLDNYLKKTHYLEEKLQLSNRMLHEIRVKYATGRRQHFLHGDPVDQPRNMMYRRDDGIGRMFSSQQACVPSSRVNEHYNHSSTSNRSFSDRMSLSQQF